MARFDKLELNPADDVPPEWRKPQREPADWLAEADREKRIGEYEAALRYYSRALEADKSLIVGWVGQCQMLVELGEYREAELWSQKALELFPNNGDLLAAQAQAVCRDGDPRRAVVLADVAIKERGQSPYRWIVRGEAMLCTGMDPSRHCFDKALPLEPDWLIPLDIARVYLFHDRPGHALGRARQAADKAGDQPYVWLIFARCQYELGMFKPASLSLQRCLELRPNFSEARDLLAKVSRGGNWSVKRFWRRLFG